MIIDLFFPDSHLPGFFPSIHFSFTQKFNYFLAYGLQCFTIEFVVVEHWKLQIKNNLTCMHIERNHLMGKGVGFFDVHLLASAQLTGVPLWTADKKL